MSICFLQFSVEDGWFILVSLNDGKIYSPQKGTYTKHGPGSMDHPWTRSIDHPIDLVTEPGPWTTPNFQKEIASVNTKIYRRSGYEKHRLVFIAYVLEGLSRKIVKEGCFGITPPHNLKTTNSFWDTEDLVHFYPQYFHSNTFKLQFDREDTSPPSSSAYYTLSCIKISRFIS